MSLDEQRRTGDENIFAIGDVVGGMLLVHEAMHEGEVAARVIAGHDAAFQPRAIPAVVYTVPQIAWCGPTELQAEAEGPAIKSRKAYLRWRWAPSPRTWC